MARSADDGATESLTVRIVVISSNGIVQTSRPNPLYVTVANMLALAKGRDTLDTY